MFNMLIILSVVRKELLYSLQELMLEKSFEQIFLSHATLLEETDQIFSRKYIIFNNLPEDHRDSLSQ